MADDKDYGAAQPIIDVAKRAYGLVSKLGDPTKPAAKAKDTTDYGWHAQKVAEANKSHADAEKKTTRKRASGK
jgi:hypothetical protein